MAQFNILKRITMVLLSIPILFFLPGCNFIYKDNGLAGYSLTAKEAINNGSPVYYYIPDKSKFHLLDGTTLITDTVWTEVSFYHMNGQRILDSSYGYHFSIPFRKSIPRTFTFTFSLLDTTNKVFTNGITEDLCQLCPLILKDEMKVVLEQKDTNEAKGWANPLVTDTITYTRMR